MSVLLQHLIGRKSCWSAPIFSAMAVFLSASQFSIRPTSCVSDNSGIRWSDCSTSPYCCTYFYKAKWQTSKIFKKVLIIVLHFGLKFTQCSLIFQFRRQDNLWAKKKKIQFSFLTPPLITAQHFTLFSSTKDFSFLCDLSDAGMRDQDSSFPDPVTIIS